MTTVGSIRIKTEIDNREALRDVKEIEKILSDTGSSIKNDSKRVEKAVTDSFQRSSGKIKNAFESLITPKNDTIDGLLKYIEQISSARKKLQNELVGVNQEVAQWQKDAEHAATPKQLEKFLEVYGSQMNNTIERQKYLNAQIEEYSADIQSAQAEIQKLRQFEQGRQELKESVSNQGVLLRIRSEKEYQEALSKTQARLDIIEQEAQRISATEGISSKLLLDANSEYQKLLQQQQLLISNQDRFKKKVQDTTSSIKKMGTAGDGAGTTLNAAFSQLAGSFASGAKNVVIWAAKTLKARLESNKFTKSITGGIWKLKRFALALFSVRGAYTLVSRVASDYLSKNEELSARVSALKGLFGELAGPALEKLVTLFEKASGYANQFLEALTGINIIARSNAKALQKQAEAVNAMTAGFDEQTKLSGSSQWSTGSIVLDDGAALTQFRAFIEKLKQLWLSSKFDEFGQAITDQINSGLSYIGEKINWSDLRKSINHNVQGIVITLNHMATDIDWYGIGEGFGNGLTTVVSALNTFMSTYNFESIGQSMAKNFNGMLAGFDFKLLGDSISNFVSGIFNLLNGYFSTLDWQLVGTSVADFINGVDWVQVAQDCFAAVKTLASGILNLLTSCVKNLNGEQLGKDAAEFITKTIEEIDWDKLIEDLSTFFWEVKKLDVIIAKAFWESIWNSLSEKYINYFKPRIEACGGNVIAGFLLGMLEFKKNIGKWIKENIFDPFIKGIKNAFGIASPAKELIPIGKNIIDGIKEGLLGNISKLKDACSALLAAIKSPFNTIDTWFKNKFSNVVNEINSVLGNIGFNVGISAGAASGGIRGTTIPKLAVGGIVNNPGRGVPVIAGEAGREAVLPLDQNTEWMDMLAGRLGAIGGTFVINVVLNGKTIQKEIVNLTDLKRFATNGAL